MAAAGLLLLSLSDQYRPHTTTNPVPWMALSPDDEDTSPTASIDRSLTSVASGSAALDEMLRGSKNRAEQWTDVPELVVLTSVMQYQAGGMTEFVATADVINEVEVEALVRDLTSALRLLTGNAFEGFAAVTREAASPGAAVRVIRPRQIVVGRYRDVQKKTGILGLGGRSVRANGGITGAAVILDADYDRTGSMRALLRTHELGHALGYNHVESRESIMNPRIGATATDLDRQIATVAYQKAVQSR